MKFTWFNLMPWPYLPDDFREKHRSVWVDIDSRLFDAEKSHEVYNTYMDLLEIPLFETTYFLSRETVVPTPGGGMTRWRERLFAAMNRNAGSVVEFFRLPDNAVVELGTRIQI